MESNQSASRAARRFLADRVRDDWDWPHLPEYWSASDEEVRGATEFRERYYGSESSSEPETDGDASAAAAANPYKFDSPDSIGLALESKAERRKRKRRMAMQSEMVWNEGLTCFVKRRDVWTGAEAVKKYSAGRVAKGEGGAMSQEERPDSATATTSSDPAASNDATSTASEPLDAEPRVPLAPPLLPDNSIRTSISPKIYSDIYNKIVVSSRTPSVPINLSDMTRALVQGWKDNGEWPPKVGPLDPLAGRKKGTVVGVKMDKGAVLHGDKFLAHHPHIKKGMDSVKHIFHLDGQHPHEHGAAENHG
ncbi:hypothetical protein BCR34DRAFT_472908 [Clohesyomyces aquaticus]|uniref:Gag1-like clamp domain-containing protein n=1 Tax=Clohesyomyces aquaticus TaxID=1231657 RepID=A0A1Y2A8W5_9PLEO|nr:hypothetical protein BCR34DRAFT_472908 [Clohesyomyces aquaticus]